MQIGELAKRTTLTVDAIRFYEKRQLLPKAIRSTGGFRLYTTGDIEQLHFIRQMHELGFSLREIRELIDLHTRKVASVRISTRTSQKQTRGRPCQAAGTPETRIRADGRFAKVQ